MITWDTVITGLIVGIIAGIGQAIGAWFIIKVVLKKIDKRAEELKETVEELHLTPSQKSEFARKLGRSSIDYIQEYGETLKGALLWWKK